MKYVAIKKWKTGEESTMAYFISQEETLRWIDKQKQPITDEFQWCVGCY